MTRRLLNIYRRNCHVKKARSSPAATVEITSPEKVFLSMTSYLSRRSGLDKFLRYSFPISFSYFLQPKQEQLVLFLTPWDSCLEKTRTYKLYFYQSTAQKHVRRLETDLDSTSFPLTIRRNRNSFIRGSVTGVGFVLILSISILATDL